MERKNDNYFIPVNGNLIQVTKEVYDAYYQPIWRARTHARWFKECYCPKDQILNCDGICPGCPFHSARNEILFSTPIGGENEEITIGDKLVDTSPSPEDAAIKKEALDVLHAELSHLSPNQRCIFELLMKGMTEREMAAEMGISQTTLNYQKNKLISKLREALKDFGPLI